MEEYEWAWWIVGGIALMVAELLFGSFFVLWFGIGAFLVGVIVLLVPVLTLPMQIAIWIAFSVALALLWFRFLKPGLGAVREPADTGEIIGEAGVVTREIKPTQKGMVQFQRPVLGEDRWEAISDQPIAIGERVKVVGIEGNLLNVSPT